VRPDDSELRAENAELRVEVEDLRAEVVELREQRRQAGRATIAAGGIVARVFTGRELTAAARAWLEAKTAAAPLPVDETADVVAAVVRRWFGVRLWHMALASGGVITAGILIWQGFLVRSQIEQQQAQNKLIRDQIEQQAADTLIVRRTQLLDTIYTTECSDPDDPETCWPKAHPRARQEAASAFIKIESGRGVSASLTGADLTGQTSPARTSPGRTVVAQHQPQHQH
jgi:hypothetical protein